MAKKRKTRRKNPAASERAASARVTYGGELPASAKAASARPVAKPPVDIPLPASAKPAAKKSNVAGILAAVFGVAAVGGVAWWIFSRRAEAAEGESSGEFEPSGESAPPREWSELTPVEKTEVFRRTSKMQKLLKVHPLRGRVADIVAAAANRDR